MVEVTRQHDVTVIRLGASYQSLDEDALEEVGGLLLTEAATADPPRMVLDLSDTSFIGSTFVELMVRVWKRLRERGGTMVLCGVQPFCAEVLRVARLDVLWECYTNRDQALSALGE